MDPNSSPPQVGPALATSVLRYTNPSASTPAPTSNTYTGNDGGNAWKGADGNSYVTGPNGVVTAAPTPATDPSVPAPVDENAIRESTRQNMQSTIDAINANYSNLIAKQGITNEDNSGKTRAVDARSGLLGSDFGNAHAAGQQDANNKATQAIVDEQSQKIAAVNTQIDQQAQAEIAAKKQEALGNADAYSKTLATNQAAAKSQISDLAKSGVDLSKLGPNAAKLFQQAGIDPALGELLYNSQKPKASQIDYQYKTVGNQLIAYGIDPTTGQLKSQQVNLPSDVASGVNYTPHFAPDGTMMLVPDKFDPNIPAEQQIKTMGNYAKPTATKATSATGGTATGTGSGTSSTPTSGDFTESTTNFWAQASSSGVNLNSLIPSLGMGSAAVKDKTAILNKIATNAQTLGIDGSTFGAMLTDSKAKQKAMTALQAQGSQTQVNEQSAGKYFDTLSGLADKVDASLFKTGAPILDGWIRSGQLALTGDSNTNNFMTQMTEALTEYAKVMSGQTSGAGVDQAARAAAQGLLNKGFSASTIKSFVNVAKKNMSDRTGSYNDALKGLFGDIKNIQTSSGGLGGSTDQSTTPSSGRTSSGINYSIQP